MKKITLLLLLLLSFACKSITKETYLSNVCECLEGVESSSENLKEEVADCVQGHIVAYNKGANYSVKKYLEEHPSATKAQAQNYVIEDLHQALLASCSKYITFYEILNPEAASE